MENISQNDIRYKEAEKRVKKIKSFYMSVIIYVFVNIFILFLNYKALKAEQTIWELKYFALPFFWGMGLLIYGMVVFIPGFFLGKNWEERKVKQLMEDENKY
ncbi:2TM domain-containing protein [Chryseobacterium oryctis]|uniref:2TM domain-containing protein n=1 Tax=Chryseobacterium oryctis TaxID=2952618 RepID=A0ABT3HM24_9FLAO|nr:2TM domain-containing protein [Chryseobacterium oryctis]MCW3160678.1 2TM domain-containing protein [Chryseobacterium oryctis]